MSNQDNNFSQDAFQHIYLLYELSLSIGQSLDLVESCEQFAKNLHKKQHLDTVSIWIKNKWLSQSSTLGRASLVYGFPKFKTNHTEISLNHPIFHILPDAKEGLFINEEHTLFKDVITEKKVNKGIYGIFQLSNIGFLKIYSSNPTNFNQEHLERLSSIIKKFAVSLEGCIAHQSATENEYKIQKIINSALDAVVIIDEKGYITDWNSQAEQIFGWKKNEVIYQEMGQFIIPPKHRSAHKAGMDHYHSTGEGPVLNSRIEITAIRRNGEEFDIELTVIPIKLDNKTIFSAFIRDITESNKAKLALIEAREKAEASSKAKANFLANMSHEFRTPLNAISGMAELLEQSKIDLKQKSFVRAIQASSNNLIYIINDILDVSKIDSGKFTIDEIGFNLREVIYNLTQSLKLKAEKKEIKLQLNMEPNISPVLLGDPVRLGQILINLLNNAIKFTHEGSVVLNIKLKEKQEDTEHIYFEVKDTGIGIEAEKVKSIFDSFTQEDDSITRRFGGTGLGLAIVQKLVELMKGEIKVESVKDLGSKFHFILPLKVGTANDLVKKEFLPIDKDTLVGKRILLVEDHDLNQMLAVNILHKYKMHVDIAETGIQAIDKLKQNTYDVILMDLHMPEMDGFEATEFIRKEMKNQTPIIALTANVITKERERCKHIGMNDFIAKPFKSAELLRKITHLTEGSIPNPNLDTDLPPTDLPLYDLAKLRREAAGNESFVQKMLNLFIQRFEETCTQLNKEHQEHNWSKVYALSHRIKPSIDLLDIHPLKEVVREIELAAKFEKDLDTINSKVKYFNEIGQQILEALKQELETT